MHVGIAHITLRLPENHSLKGKRQVVKSVIARLQNEFNLSVAEVSDNDAWQVAGIGLCCVSNSHTHAEQMLHAAIEYIERSRLDVEIVDTEIEVLSA